MIPTVILIAFLIARWWAVAVGVVLWPLALVIWGDPDITLAGLVGGAILAAANAVVGVVAGQVSRRLFRSIWKATPRVSTK